jgi:uncharacterized protein YndB with AHSA1/START domain
MPIVALERRLVKSPPEVWEELSSEDTLNRWLGELRVTATDPPRLLEWEAPGRRGTIRLEPLGWGTKVLLRVEIDVAPAWERLQARYGAERSLRALLEHLGRGSLKSDGLPRRAFG